MRNVISAVGEQRFDSNIRQLADALEKRANKRKSFLPPQLTHQFSTPLPKLAHSLTKQFTQRWSSEEASTSHEAPSAPSKVVPESEENMDA